MPASDVSVDMDKGVYEVRIAYSNSNRLYIYYNGQIYRSDDKGKHWLSTLFPKIIDSPNDNYRALGKKMAVDPINPDVVYVGSPSNGIFVTKNGGRSWQQLKAIPNGMMESGTAIGHVGITFDHTSGTTDGKTNSIYLPSWGYGIWQSVDAGETWKQISGADLGGPLKIRHAVVTTDGVFYVITYEGDQKNKLFKYSEGKWTDITPVSTQGHLHSVAPDPFDAAHVVVGTTGGSITQTFDGGTTWTKYMNPGPSSRVAMDIPWLAWTKESWMTNGDMQFDPITHELLFAEGIGVWKTNLVQNLVDFKWTSESKGIEQLVPNVVTVPPNGKPVLGAWDRPLFYVDDPNVYPSFHGPNNSHSIVMGWDIDWSLTDPRFLTALVNWGNIEESGYSNDGGKTWLPFPSYPQRTSSNYGGGIAVSTPNNIVWVPSNKNPPYYTKDGGKSWTKVTIPDIPDNTPGWGWAYYFNRHIIAADRVTPGTFYLYHTPNGIYRSIDGGENWVLMHSGELSIFSGFNAKLKSVPGKAGHLFFTAGQSGKLGDKNPDQSRNFVHSIDGGVSWNKIPNVSEVYDFGFGKEAPGSDYPTIYMAGWVKNRWGIWESNNEGKTWFKIGDFPTGSLAEITSIDGDKTTYGKVYVGLSGNGYAYGEKIFDTQKPTISIITPKNHEKVSGTVNITATSNGNGNGNANIKSMILYINGSAKAATLGNKLIFNWDTNKYQQGKYYITVTAIDSSKNIGMKTAVVSK
jgi:photosystem II stability/assembly factor-like uncharacterized protein